LVVRCYDRARLIVISNKSFMNWREVFNDQVLASAFPDRLLHHATTRWLTPVAAVSIGSKST